MSKGQPNWAKFGLDPDERQPLKPTSGPGPSTGATAKTTMGGQPQQQQQQATGGQVAKPGEMFGSQAQNENELFADDQVFR